MPVQVREQGSARPDHGDDALYRGATIWSRGRRAPGVPWYIPAPGTAANGWSGTGT